MSKLTESYLSYLNVADLNQDELQEHFNVILNESKVNSKKLINSYKKNINVAKTFLKKYKVDLSYIKKQANKASAYVKKQHANGVPAKEVSKNIVNKYTEPMMKKVVKQVQVVGQRANLDLDEKIIRSIVILILVIFINTFLMTMTAVVLGVSTTSFIVSFITAVIVAPIVEEYAKRISILQDYPFIYTGIFATTEAIMYIAGGAPITARIVLIAFHFALMIIQKNFHDTEIENGKETSGLTGYVVAVGIHALWNGLAVTAQFSAQ